MAKSRPVVTISAAMSVDGKIATKRGDSGLSSKRDLVRVHRLRSEADAVLVGANTVRRDDPLLTVRYTGGKSPARIVLDSRGSIRTDSKIIRTAGDIRTIIAVSRSASKKNLARLERLRVETVVCGEKRVNIRQLLRRLASRNIRTLLVEGGGTVNWEFIKSNLFDRLVVTVSPRIIGGTGAVSLVQGPGFSGTATRRLRLEKAEKNGDEIVLYYANPKACA